MESCTKTKEGYNVWIKGNKCYRCGHEWKPRDLKEKPEVCPKCKNPYWNKPLKNKKVIKNE